MNPPQSDDARAGTATHVIMFWLLTSMALAVFTPCVLVPIWARTQAIRAYEDSLTVVVDDLERTIERNDKRIQALLGDPLVNERIVRRELNYQPEGESIIRWAPEALASVPSRLPDQPAEQPTPASPAAAASRLGSLQRWLPNWPWSRLFAESPSRPLLLLMAGGLLATAFVLYGPRPARTEAVQ